MVTKAEVLEYLRRKGKYMKLYSKKDTVLTGIGMRRLDVVKFFRRQGHCDITKCIKRLILSNQLYYRVIDGEEYVIVPMKLIEWLEKKRVEKFTELVDWRKLGRRPLSDL